MMPACDTIFIALLFQSELWQPSDIDIVA